MQNVLKELEERRAQARLGGGQKRIDAQHAKGKLTARERIELLLQQGANIEAVDSDGRTALRIATINERELAMQCLLRNGARERATDN